MIEQYKKIIIISDIHLVKKGEKVKGIRTSESLSNAVRHIMIHQTDAEYVLFTGDLTHSGKTSEYRLLKKLISPLQLPITFLLGNHDNRSNFYAVFPEVASDPNGFLQYCFKVNNKFFVCLDTLNCNPDIGVKHAGFLCEERLAWLEEKLLILKDENIVICMHHPHFDVGFQKMDKIKLWNSDQFLKLLKTHKSINYIITGHIHRRISGVTDGINFSTFNSVSYQMPMLLSKENIPSEIVKPSSYGVLLIGSNSIVVHSEDY